jgi:hypothetical protein
MNKMRFFGVVISIACLYEPFQVDGFCTTPSTRSVLTTPTATKRIRTTAATTTVGRTITTTIRSSLPSKPNASLFSSSTNNNNNQNIITNALTPLPKGISPFEKSLSKNLDIQEQFRRLAKKAVQTALADASAPNSNKSSFSSSSSQAQHRCSKLSSHPY